MSPNARTPGRVRIRLAELLEAAMPQLTVNPVDLYDARGSYRTSARADAPRWEGYARLKELPNVVVSLRSYSTMESCVRHGVDCSFDGRAHVDVEAKEKRS